MMNQMRFVRPLPRFDSDDVELPRISDADLLEHTILDSEARTHTVATLDIIQVEAAETAATLEMNAAELYSLVATSRATSRAHRPTEPAPRVPHSRARTGKYRLA